MHSCLSVCCRSGDHARLWPGRRRRPDVRIVGRRCVLTYSIQCVGVPLLPYCSLCVGVPLLVPLLLIGLSFLAKCPTSLDVPFRSFSSEHRWMFPFVLAVLFPFRSSLNERLRRMVTEPVHETAVGTRQCNVPKVWIPAYPNGQSSVASHLARSWTLSTDKGEPNGKK